MELSGVKALLADLWLLLKQVVSLLSDPQGHLTRIIESAKEPTMCQWVLTIGTLSLVSAALVMRRVPRSRRQFVATSGSFGTEQALAGLALAVEFAVARYCFMDSITLISLLWVVLPVALAVVVLRIVDFILGDVSAEIGGGTNAPFSLRRLGAASAAALLGTLVLLHSSARLANVILDLDGQGGIHVASQIAAVL